MGCKHCGGDKTRSLATVGKGSGFLGKFGRCSRCFFLAIMLFVGCVVIALPSFLIDLPPFAELLRASALLACMLWLSLHIFGFLLHRLRH